MRSLAYLTLLSLPLLAACSSVSAKDCGATGSFNLGVVTSNQSGAGGVADHTAKSPGNQAQFLASITASNTDATCPISALASTVRSQWTVSDNIDITISSVNDSTNGLATCNGATLSPATVTASYTQNGQTKTASTTLTCK